MISIKKGFTLVETLVTMIILSIFFLIVVLVFSNFVESYKIARTNLQTLYADNYVTFLFDIIESEVKYAGSGANLFKGEFWRPTYTPGNANSYVRLGQKYNEFTTRTWLADSIDYDPNTKTLYISYVLTYPIILRRNSDGTYTPINEGYLGHVGWGIAASSINPNAPGYKTRYVKFNRLEKITGSGQFPGIVKRDDKYYVYETNLAVQSVTYNMNNSYEPTTDSFIYFISKFKDAIFENGYFTRAFRQIQIRYDQNQKKIVLRRFMPALDLSTNYVDVDILTGVKDFKIYLLTTRTGQVEEIEFGQAKQIPNFPKNSVFALKVYLHWESDWTLYGRKQEIIKTRTFILLSML